MVMEANVKVNLCSTQVGKSKDHNENLTQSTRILEFCEKEQYIVHIILVCHQFLRILPSCLDLGSYSRPGTANCKWPNTILIRYYEIGSGFSIKIVYLQIASAIIDILKITRVFITQTHNQKHKINIGVSFTGPYDCEKVPLTLFVFFYQALGLRLYLSFRNLFPHLQIECQHFFNNHLFFMILGRCIFTIFMVAMCETSMCIESK